MTEVSPYGAGEKDGVVCPYCKNPAESTVSETRARGAQIRRKRSCKGCGSSYWTREQIDESEILVRKANGQAQKFQRDKIATGIRKGARASRMSEPEVTSIVDSVVTDVYQIASENNNEIQSRVIGEHVLSRLRASESAYIRYAIVFRGRIDRPNDDSGESFRDVNGLLRWLENQYPLSHSGTLNAGEPRQVMKKTGRTERFERSKLEKSIGIAAKGRLGDTALKEKATELANFVLSELEGHDLVTAGQLSAGVLRQLEYFDDLAYIRYAAVAKGLTRAYDIYREALHLEERKRRSAEPDSE